MEPGEYTPDSTEGITRVEDLPTPLQENRARDYRLSALHHSRRARTMSHSRNSSPDGLEASLEVSALLGRTDIPSAINVRRSRRNCSKWSCVQTPGSRGTLCARRRCWSIRGR